jgi:hypothetical protein
MSLVFQRMLNAMLAELAVDGITVPRELRRAKLAAELWHVSLVLDDDGRIVDLVSSQDVEWPPIAN